MSLSNADVYARRCRSSDDASEIGDNVYRAVEELIREIKKLQADVRRLESKMR
jgi:hypothetical protein